MIRIEPRSSGRFKSVLSFSVVLIGLTLQVVWMIALLVVSAVGWGTHVYTCFTREEWWFLLAGAILFPIGIVHGAGVWLGFW